MQLSPNDSNIRFKITFSGFALPYDQPFYVKAEDIEAARECFRKSNRTATVVSIEEVKETDPFGRVYAVAGEC